MKIKLSILIETQLNVLRSVTSDKGKPLRWTNTKDAVRLFLCKVIMTSQPITALHFLVRTITGLDFSIWMPQKVAFYTTLPWLYCFKTITIFIFSNNYRPPQPLNGRQVSLVLQCYRIFPTGILGSKFRPEFRNRNSDRENPEFWSGKCIFLLGRVKLDLLYRLYVIVRWKV